MIVLDGWLEFIHLVLHLLRKVFGAFVLHWYVELANGAWSDM